MVYTQSTVFTCGPSSYMEAFCKSKNKKKEKELHEIGRIKPAKIFLGISFLEIDPNLILYTQKKHPVNIALIKLIYEFENFKGRVTLRNLSEKIKKNYRDLVKKHRKNIVEISEIKDVIQMLEIAHVRKKKALLLSHTGYWDKNGILHWIYFKGKSKNGRFIFSDSHTGSLRHFTKQDVIQFLKLTLGESPLQIVTNFRI